MADKIQSKFEKAAMLGCDAMIEYLEKRNTRDDGMEERLVAAKIGAVGMGAYAKLRGTMANEEQLRLAAQKFVGPRRLAPALSGESEE